MLSRAEESGHAGFSINIAPCDFCTILAPGDLSWQLTQLSSISNLEYTSMRLESSFFAIDGS